jgi:Uncharacterised nucleotidyltransferase
MPKMHDNPSLSFNAEDSLCLLLARGQLTSDEQFRARELLSSPVDWSQVLEKAYVHEVYPLVYSNLRELGFSGVPDAIRTELKCAYLANAIRNQLLSQELAHLLRQLSGARIPAIPLKGVSLAQSLYGDPGNRVSTDIDLLVPPPGLDRAIEIIRAAGYPDAFDDPFFRKLDLRYGRHYAFRRDHIGCSTNVELHWRLIQHSSQDQDAVAALWAEAQPTRCFGAPAHRLSPEWEFLYLAIHAADHGWQGLKWLLDLHHLSITRPPDWHRVKKKAEQFRIERVVRHTLIICSRLLGTPLPDGYKWDSLTTNRRLIPCQLSSGASDPGFAHLELLDRPWDKLRCLTNVVFVPKPADREFVRLPGILSLLYYPLRALRLLGKHGWALISSRPHWSKSRAEPLPGAKNRAGTIGDKKVVA